MMTSRCSRSFIALERALGCPVAAHTVNCATGWGGGRAEVYILERGGVLAPGWPQKKLQAGKRAAVDVASHQVCIPRLHGRSVKDSPGQDALAKTGGEAFHLGFNRFQSGAGPTIGDVTVAPGDMLARRCTAGVKQRGLREQDKGPVSYFPLCGSAFGSCNFIESPAEVDGARTQAVGGSPWNGLAQGPVHLEHPGTVAIALQLAPERGRKVAAGDGQQLPRSDVEKCHVPAVPQRQHGRIGGDCSAGVLQTRDQCIRYGLRSALGD